MDARSIALARKVVPSEGRHRTRKRLPHLAGRSIFQLHEAYWGSQGGQVLDVGSDNPLNTAAKFYVLQAGRLLTIPDTFNWLAHTRGPDDITWLRIVNSRSIGYREYCHVDDEGRFVRFSRHYDARIVRSHRLGITRCAELAEIWKSQGSVPEAWREIRRATSKKQRSHLTVSGSLYNWMEPADATAFALELVRNAPLIAEHCHDLTKIRDGVFAADPHRIDPRARIIGQAWIGYNRDVGASDCLIGPAILWDRNGSHGDANNSESNVQRSTHQSRPFRSPSHHRPRSSAKLGYRITKRAFDIAFALVALTITLPLYPLVALAIWLEDGWPIFFSHRRETVGGREFGCWKFRSMRRDAEEVRERIGDQNRCDGPQFFIDDDPRMTRIGRLIRDIQIDEWPQFFQVLMGTMSVVGPRPLPRRENQYCPSWREARLSVPPGITGLWQVRRRRREGEDFQEWIRYDIHYVEHASTKLDFWILGQTIAHLFRLIGLRTWGRLRRQV